MLFDAAAETASESETLADWTIMVLVFFGALHFALMPYKSRRANIFEAVLLLFVLPFQTLIAQLDHEAHNDFLHPNARVSSTLISRTHDLAN